MFCNHTSVNQLTALLPAHGVRDAVVCPGSRNGAIVHNLHELGDRMRLFPVTDERCAGFAALGISLHTQRPVAVCVTSGSALLNTLPAVAEAFYQHIPLLVVSADRPEALIGQLDGQTLPQQGALLPYCRTWQLAEGTDEAARRLNNRRINEALRSLSRHGGQPAHINVPLAAPLFEFTTPCLPAERMVDDVTQAALRPIPDALVRRIADAGTLPLLVLGQLPTGCAEAVKALDRRGALLVLPEITANVPGNWRTNHSAELEGLAETPLHVLHMGGNFIGKQLKEMLRRHADAAVFRFGEEAETPDTFGHLAAIVRCSPQAALRQLAEELPGGHAGVKSWQERLDAPQPDLESESGRFDEASAVHAIVRRIESGHDIAALHLANSLAVRLAQRCFRHTPPFPVHCNRGVNGIEGSVSSAAGYALSSAGCDEKPMRPTLLVTGDLSFHYDSNALWNDRLGGNLRIVVLNNGGGRIFRTLPGLADSPARDPFIAGGNTSTARGICESHHATYLTAHSADTLRSALDTLLTAEASRPMLLEVLIP